MGDWHYQDMERHYCVTHEGKKIAMPRYYKDRIYTLDEREAFNQRRSIEIIQQNLTQTNDKQNEKRKLKDAQRLAWGKPKRDNRKGGKL
jgi:hypothetical protein